MLNFCKEKVMRRLGWLLIGAMLPATAGCVSNDAVVRKQMEMEARLEQLAQANVATNARMTELDGEVSALRQQMKAANADLAALHPTQAGLKTSLDEVNQRLADMGKFRAKLEGQSAATAITPKIEVVNSEPLPAGKEAAHQDAYMKAFGLFSANKYNDAIEAFAAFVTTYPASEYVGNALYWIGECHFNLKNYVSALESFNKVVAEYPDGQKAPDAMLMIGFSLITMNEPAKAKAALQSLVEKYPDSQAAAKAKERLGSL
jgi:tol-pal system protein YbgF